MSTTILDRKELGLTAFWEKFKKESKASRPVHIRTGCKEWAELPLAEGFWPWQSAGGIDGSIGGVGAVAAVNHDNTRNRKAICFGLGLSYSYPGV